MLCLLDDSKTYVVNCCCFANCERREGVGPWGSNIHAYYRIQHFLWSLPLCRAGLLNMLPCLLKAYVEVQILHKWNAGPCSGLYFTHSIPALEFNICFSWIFVQRNHNSSELNVQLKDFLNSNGLKWSLSLIPISILLSSAEVFLCLYKANFLWPDRNFFQSYFAACSYQVNVPVEFLIVIEIPVAKCYLICSRKAIDLCIWLQFPSPFQPFYFSHNRTNTFLWGKWELEGASWAINVQFLFFFCACSSRSEVEILPFCRVVFNRKWLPLNALYSYDNPDCCTMLFSALCNVSVQRTWFQRLP